MGHPRYSTEEIAARGEALYEGQLRAKLEPDNFGKYLIIDIETGDYEIDADDLTLMLRASEKHPGAARHLLRIGYATSGMIGGGWAEGR